MRTLKFRPARCTAVRMLLIVVLVAAVTTPLSVPSGGGLPVGAVGEAPSQVTGSALEGVRRGAPHPAIAAAKRDQARPAGAVPDQASAVLPVRLRPSVAEHSRPAVRQEFTGPAIDPAAVERPQDRTASTDTFQNRDGSRTLRAYSQPRNVRQPDGGWLPIDSGLVPAAGRLKPKVAGVKVDFATTAADPALARFAYDDQHVLSYGIEGAAPSVGQFEGAEVAYAHALPGVDVRLAAVASGFQEQLVLASREVPVSYGYTLKLTGLQPKLNAKGGVDLVDGAKVIGLLPAGVMWDSAADRATSSEVHYGLKRLGPDSWTLSLDIDRTWLRDPARVFPVVVDPSAAQPDADADDTFVRSNWAGDHSALTELETGKVDSGLARSYLHLGAALASLRNDYILGGALNLKAVYSNTTNLNRLSVFEVTQPWNGGQAWPGAAVGRLLGQSEAFSAGCPAAGQPCANPKVIPVKIDGDVLTDWTHGAALGNGLSVRASDESNGAGMRFASVNNPGGPPDPRPFLDVAYAPEGASYSVTDVLQPTANQAGSMNVQVTNRGSTTWNGNYRFGYSVVETGASYRDTPLPSVGPGGVATLATVPIHPLNPGRYHLRLTVWDASGQDFATADGVPYGELQLDVNDVAPTSNYQQPASGDTIETVAPTLYAEGVDPDAWPDKGLTYKFRICANPQLTDQPGVPCAESGWGGQSWAPPADKLFWGRTYYWGVLVNDTVKSTSCWVGPDYDPAKPGECAVLADSPRNLRFSTRVPQPEITSHLAGSPGTVEGPGLDPQIGNYSVAATDSSVATVGPDLTVNRIYNSLDPRRNNAFGLGWASRLDMRLAADGDGSRNVVLTYPDGRQLRFGRNPDGSFASPAGDSAALVQTNGGGSSYTLRDSSGGEWLFDGALRLITIIDPAGLRENLHYATGTDRIDTITSVITGQPDDRALTLTWGDGKHVTEVRASAPALGEPAPSWTYTYDGDRLMSACAPNAPPNCTKYGYTGGSHYRSSVADDNPFAYWRFDEQPDATTTLGSAIARHAGGESGVAHGVLTNSQPGALAGTSDGAATFTGTSYVNLPGAMTTETMSLAAELWFKTTGSGTLLAVQNKDFVPGAGAGDPTMRAAPVLYVGTDGLLYGGYPTREPGGNKQVASAAPVNDGTWHHAVLSTAINTQALYLDGHAVGSVGGYIDQRQLGSAVLGAGYAKGAPATNDGDFFFTGGSIDEAAIYQHTLGPLAVAEHYAAGQTASELTSITLPQDNRIHATLTYDDVTDRVSTLVDQRGLKWTMDPTVVSETQDTSQGADHPRWVNPVRTAVLHGPPGYGDWNYSFDVAAGGRLVSHTHSGKTRSYEYNTKGFQSATVDEDGDRFEQTTDDHGNVLSRKGCRGKGSCNTSYSTYLTPADPLDPRGNKLASSSDARSSGPDDTTYRTTYTYDTAGRRTATTSPAPNGQTRSPVVTTAYSDGSQGADGGGTVPAGLPIRTTGARDQVTSYRYYRNGDLAELDSPAGLRTRSTYDALGRVRTTTQLNGGGVELGRTSVTYTPNSQVATRTGPRIVNPATGVAHTQVTTFGYDGDGNVTSTTVSDTLPVDQGGDQPRVTTYAFDTHDRLRQTTNPDQGVTSYAYSDDGLSTFITDVRGFVWTVANDELGRQRSSAVSGPAGSGVDPQDRSVTTLTVQVRDYTPAGRLATTTDAMGRSTTYSHWADGLLATSTAKDVQSQDGTRRDVLLDQLGYDPAGNVSQEVTAGGVTTTTGYDPAGYPLTVTFDPANLKRTTIYQRDLDGNATSVRTSGAADPSRVETTSYTYDAENLVAREDDQLSASAAYSMTYTRDERGLPTQVTDRRQVTTTYGYDGAGQLVTTTHPAAEVWTAGVRTPGVSGTETLGRNTFGEVTQAKDAAGGITRTGRDSMGRVVSGTLPGYTPPGAAKPIIATTTTGYDKAGNVISRTDPLNRLTTWIRDPYNRALSVTLPPVGDTPSVGNYDYDRTGELTGVTTPSGARHQFTYDQLGRRITSTQVDRSSALTAYYVTKTGYDDAGNVATVTTPMQETTTTSHDAAGAATLVTDPTGRATAYTYDNAGRPASTSAPTGLVTSVGYDLLGRATTVAQGPTGKPLRTTTIGYDANGNTTSTLSPQGRQSTFGYDALNRPVTQAERVDSTKSITTSTGYDALGGRAHVVDGNGHATEHTSTPWGLPESVIEPATAAHPAAAERTWTTSYDAAGQAITATAPGGIVRTRTYDAQGRLRLETGAGAEVSTSDRRLDYDLDGNVRTQSGPTGDLTYHYDDRGNLLSYTGPATAATYTYNGDNELTGRSDAAGNSTFGYDRAGRLSSAVDPITQRTMTYGYDAGGRLGAVTDNVSSQSTGRTFGYDALDRVTSDQLAQVPESGVPPVTKIGQTYGYDLDDNVTSRSDVSTAGAAANGYTYDGAGRLGSWTAPGGATTSFGWDDAGNRTSAGGQTASYDERNRLLSGGGATYTYTARGTQASASQNGQTTSSQFDAFDRQVGHGQVQYAYDSLDRAVSRNGSAIGYDGLTHNQVSVAGRVINRLPGGTPLSDKASGSAIPGKAEFANQHGDVVGRYLGGAVDGRKTYDPFGSVTASSGETSALGFQGGWTDPDSGQVDMAARWYTPATGQFSSRDSADVSPNPSWASNKYAYGNANPVTNSDPTGHSIGSCLQAYLFGTGTYIPEDDWLCAAGAAFETSADIAYDLCRNPWACFAGAGLGFAYMWNWSDNHYEVMQGYPSAAPWGRKGIHRSVDDLDGGGTDYGTDSGGDWIPRSGGGQPLRPRPPQPPPPPRWVTIINTPIERPAPGSTVGVRPPSYPTEAPPEHVFDPGPGITRAATRVTQGPAQISNATQALPGYDFRGDQSSCLDGADKGTLWYAPMESGTTKDITGNPVLDSAGNPAEYNRAPGAAGCLTMTRSAKGRKTPPRPDGYDPANRYADQSGHLIGYIFFGQDEKDNLTPINGPKTNSSLMYHAAEKQISDQVKPANPIYYRVTPMYSPNNPVPYAMHIYAVGKNFHCDVILVNSPVRNPENRGCRDAAAQP